MLSDVNELISARNVVTNDDKKSNIYRHFAPFGLRLKGTGSRLSACSLIKILFSNLFLILSVNNPTHMHLSDLREYFKLEVYFTVK